MLDGGFSGKDTAFALGIDADTVSRYKKNYLSSENLDVYLSSNHVGYSGRLNKGELTVLEKELDGSLYRSAKEIVCFIKEKFGRTYSPAGLRPLLRRLGFSYKKTRRESVKADRGKQEEFLAEMEKHLGSPKDEEVTYYIDGVHPQHNTKAEYGWIRTGGDFVVSANTGRKRVNINGALNPHDITDVLVDEAKSVNAQSTIRLMEKALRRHRKKKRIYFYADNATYYHAGILKDFLRLNPKIRVIHLPSYSPNLNLIERLWKFMRKKIINSFYYEKYEDFKNAVLGFFKDIKKYKKELETLLTLNFQIIGQ